MTVEVPLLRESSVFSGRLIDACLAGGEHRMRALRRVNWSWRYSSEFYEREAELFIADPDAYLAGAAGADARLDDVFAKNVGWKSVAQVLLKFGAHTLFLALGAPGRSRLRSRGAIYRKAYVDDIELVFDPDEEGVVRFVYPFPISIKRQWRYLSFLRKQRYPFVLDGNRYGFRDLIGFIARRDIGSLARLESRSELRNARALIGLQPGGIQLSDEFNIGGHDFARAVARAGFTTHNVAHGVGKYFPVHAYRQFDVLTQAQEDFYLASIPCDYGRHALSATFGVGERRAVDGPANAVVMLSQDFGDPQSMIGRAEARVIEQLQRAKAAGHCSAVYFKPHPNNQSPQAPAGFERIDTIERLGSLPDPILLSLFSTTHVDPRFRGRKYLVRTEHIRPEIAFDESDRIVDVDRLVDLLSMEREK